MTKATKRASKKQKIVTVSAELREKLGLSQEQFASILGISRSYVTLAESKKRTLDSSSYATMAELYTTFHELETGALSAHRSLETRLFLNEEYRKVLPGMKSLEDECRRKVKELKQQIADMKEQARNAEYAIIIFTRFIKKMEESGKNNKEHRIEGLSLWKQQAYEKLLTCWEPEQAKLHGRIEAIAGEARSLRRYRLKVMKEHAPIKNEKRRGKGR